MRVHFFMAAGTLLLAASAALAADDTAHLTVPVKPGSQVRITGTQIADRGDSTSTTWVVLWDNGKLAAVDVEPSLRASASFVITRPGVHRIDLKCDNHIARVASCTLERP
ncbi:MAG: hypothetical protein ACJ8EB_09985 [Allosphingosinicella sp.]